MSASTPRRFFFDVTVIGKSQLVQYGKLGGSLREAKKAFKSPAEAIAMTDKLIATKVREGYVEINPSRLEIVPFKGNKKATEKQILALEEQIGSSLPDEYRSFLESRNGGTPNPPYSRVPGVEGIESIGVGTLFCLRPSKPSSDELTSQFEQTRELLPQGHLPIAGSSDFFTISLRPKTFGCVFWWFHETEELDDDGNYLESAGYLLAGSFDEFLTRIAMFFDEEKSTDVEPSQDSQSRKKSKPTIKQLVRLIRHSHTPDKVSEIKQVLKGMDLSSIKNGEWPFINIDNAQILDGLLKAGLNPEITDDNRQTLLWQCASSVPCINLLMQHNVNLERRSGSQAESALMRAMFCNSIPAVKRLIELGADPTVNFPDYISCKLKTNQELRQIIEKARVQWRKGKKTQQSKAKPSEVATDKTKKKSTSTMKQLLRLMKHDFFPEYFDEIDEYLSVIADLGDLSGIKDGEWPAIDRFECPRLLKSLLDAGLNPEIFDKKGNTLLFQCVGHPDCIDLITKLGVDVDRRKSGNETALMRATYKGNEACVKSLLKAGANPTLEFCGLAKVFLSWKKEMSNLIESACKKWQPPKSPSSSRIPKVKSKRSQ
jgi:predicted DNA-binding WGR domain protein